MLEITLHCINYIWHYMTPKISHGSFSFKFFMLLEERSLYFLVSLVTCFEKLWKMEKTKQKNGTLPKVTANIIKQMKYVSDNKRPWKWRCDAEADADNTSEQLSWIFPSLGMILWKQNSSLLILRLKLGDWIWHW